MLVAYARPGFAEILRGQRDGMLNQGTIVEVVYLGIRIHRDTVAHHGPCERKYLICMHFAAKISGHDDVVSRLVGENLLEVILFRHQVHVNRML